MSQENESSYPMTDEHKKHWSELGRDLTDNEISRAWARLHDRGIVLGPAVSDKFQLGQFEHQYFVNGYAVHGLQNNPNKLVVFNDARGVVGTESGL